MKEGIESVREKRMKGREGISVYENSIAINAHTQAPVIDDIIRTSLVIQSNPTMILAINLLLMFLTPL